MHDTQFQCRFFRPVVCGALGPILNAGGLASRDAKPVTSGVDIPQLQDAPSALPLSLQTDRGIQRGRDATNTLRRQRTAKRLHDDATSRLCGVQVGRNCQSEARPFAWPGDSLLFLSVSGLFITVALTFTGGLQGTGDTRSPLFITLVSQFAIPIGVLTYVQATQSLQTWHVWTAIVMGHATRCVLSVWRFEQGKWRTIELGLQGR